MTKRYDNIDCLRALSCFAIIAMHIQANTHYKISGFVFNKVIPSWTWLVYLFLIISGFSMCCGYFGRIAERTIDLDAFYHKRFQKAVPFFAFLVLIAVVMERTKESAYEGFIELTMTFGLLPNNSLELLGVCWTLGVIFVFYMMFPYFVFLLNDKKRAWFTLITSLVLNQLCSTYFFTEKFVLSTFTPRHSFLFCTPFFISGGYLVIQRKDRSVCFQT